MLKYFLYFSLALGNLLQPRANLFFELLPVFGNPLSKDAHKEYTNQDRSCKN